MRNPEFNDNSDICKAENTIEQLREGLTSDSWKNSLDELIKLVEKEASGLDVSITQSKVAFLLEDMTELWLKDGGDINELADEVKIFFETKPNLSKFFTTPRPSALGKRQPTVIESIEATFDRFKAMGEIEEALESQCDGIIVGGSLSYGPFYNLRSSKDETGSSDIDAIALLTNNTESNSWDNLKECKRMHPEDKSKFVNRFKIFSNSLTKNGTADVFSHKFPVVGTDFDISIHFFTEESFDKILNPDMSQQNHISILKDYKEKKFIHEFCKQRNFEGQEYAYKTPDQTEVEGGVVTQLPAYIMHDGKYYPGIYQNLILPRFFIYYDKNGGVTDKVSGFKNKITTHIKNQYGEDDINRRMLLSHTRNVILPPTLEREM